MGKKIIITEEQYRNVKENLLGESRLSVVKDKFLSGARNDRKRQEMEEDWTGIVQADPSRNKQYVQWLTNLYKSSENRSVFMEDLYKASEYLAVFDRVKGRLALGERDINKYRSLPDLNDAILKFRFTDDEGGEQIVDKPVVWEDDFVRKKGGEKVYEDSKWVIIVPRKLEAERFYGSQTEWCTLGENMFRHYTAKGDLFIICDRKITTFDRKNNTRMQFHFQDQQYKDIDDRDIDIKGFLNKNKGIKDFFVSYVGEKVSIKELFRIGYNGSVLGFLPATTKVLDLSKCELTAVPKEVSRFTDLETLNLSDNPITSLGSVLTPLSNMHSLFLQNTHITDIPEGTFTGWDSLSFINFSGTRLTRIPPDLYEHNESLVFVAAYGSKIPDEERARFTDLTDIDVS